MRGLPNLCMIIGEKSISDVYFSLYFTALQGVGGLTINVKLTFMVRHKIYLIYINSN